MAGLPVINVPEQRPYLAEILGAGSSAFVGGMESAKDRRIREQALEAQKETQEKQRQMMLLRVLVEGNVPPEEIAKIAVEMGWGEAGAAFGKMRGKPTEEGVLIEQVTDRMWGPKRKAAGASLKTERDITNAAMNPEAFAEKFGITLKHAWDVIGKASSINRIEATMPAGGVGAGGAVGQPAPTPLSSVVSGGAISELPSPSEAKTAEGARRRQRVIDDRMKAARGGEGPDIISPLAGVLTPGWGYEEQGPWPHMGTAGRAVTAFPEVVGDMVKGFPGSPQGQQLKRVGQKVTGGASALYDLLTLQKLRELRGSARERYGR